MKRSQPSKPRRAPFLKAPVRLLSLQLTQFRSYGSLQIALPSKEDVHLFVGPNGSGKSNLLQAIAILSLTRSSVGLEEDDLRQWGADFYRIRAEAQSDAGEQCTLELVSQLLPRRQKACFRNDVRIQTTSMVGLLPVVSFLPEDMDLFTGSPSLRRAFLDDILSQVSPEYLHALGTYQKVLKHRNALLKQIATGREQESALEPWDVQAAEAGSRIVTARLELIETLGLTLAEELHALGEPWGEVRFLYERSGAERTVEALQHELRMALHHYRSRDILLQSTSVGPHRDDWHLEVDGHRLETTGSRGQQRVALLALLFLQASYLEIRRGERPVILLDDLFSELDPPHQERILQSFRDHQVFLTATHVPSLSTPAQVWDLVQGEIVRR